MPLRHILVLEDSDEDFDTVQDAARHSGVLQPIVRAASGAECLRLLGLGGRAQPATSGLRSREALPLLVLIDLNTPGDSGREVLLHVRRDDLLGTLPVVVLTASANPRDLQFCYANGANAYHVKPVAHPQHLRVLQQIFGYWLGSAMLPA